MDLQSSPESQGTLFWALGRPSEIAVWKVNKPLFQPTVRQTASFPTCLELMTLRKSQMILAIVP
jgi:hypothetical protein